MKNTKHSPSSVDLKKFGLIFGITTVILFGLLLPLLFEKIFPIWPWVIFLISGSLALLYPMSLNLLYNFHNYLKTYLPLYKGRYFQILLQKHMILYKHLL